MEFGSREHVHVLRLIERAVDEGKLVRMEAELRAMADRYDGLVKARLLQAATRVKLARDNAADDD